MDDKAVRSDAYLAHIAHLGALGPDDGLVQVGVVEDDEGSVATKFHRGAQYVLGSLAQQICTHPGRPGEGQFAQSRILQDGVSDSVIQTSDDIENTGWQTSFEERLGKQQGGQRGSRGRANHHSAPSSQSRGDLAGSHRQREVPWGDE